MAASIIMFASGLGILGIWTADLLSGKFAGKGNFFAWREGEHLLWPHILAEYLTGMALVTGGAGLLMSRDWAFPVSFLALGALIYTAINSSGWVLANKSRMGYGIPIWISLAGAVAAVVFLVV